VQFRPLLEVLRRWFEMASSKLSRKSEFGRDSAGTAE
jgi:hypothetical protein